MENTTAQSINDKEKKVKRLRFVSNDAPVNMMQSSPIGSNAYIQSFSNDFYFKATDTLEKRSNRKCRRHKM